MKTHNEQLEEYYNTFFSNISIPRSQVKSVFESGVKLVTTHKYYTAVNTLYNKCIELCNENSELLKDRERLIALSASLGVAIRDNQDTDILYEEWKSLPDQLQKAINAEEEKIDNYSK